MSDDHIWTDALGGRRVILPDGHDGVVLRGHHRDLAADHVRVVARGVVHTIPARDLECDDAEIGRAPYLVWALGEGGDPGESHPIPFRRRPTDAEIAAVTGPDGGAIQRVSDGAWDGGAGTWSRTLPEALDALEGPDQYDEMDIVEAWTAGPDTETDYDRGWYCGDCRAWRDLETEHVSRREMGLDPCPCDGCGMPQEVWR